MPVSYSPQREALSTATLLSLASGRTFYAIQKKIYNLAAIKNAGKIQKSTGFAKAGLFLRVHYTRLKKLSGEILSLKKSVRPTLDYEEQFMSTGQPSSTERLSVDSDKKQQKKQPTTTTTRKM